MQSAVAGAGSAREDVAQVKRNCSGIADEDNGKFSQDTLDGDFVENGVPVVKLLYNPRAEQFQQSCNTQILSITAIIAIIDIMDITIP